MASEEDLTESTSQVPQAIRRGASENLRCPICRAAINDRASMGWRRHPFCFYCMVEWLHKRVEGLSPFPHTFHMVGDSNSQVHSIGEPITSASHTQGERAGPRSAERRQHRSPGRQRRKSYSRSCGGSHGGSRSGRHGGSRGRAQKKSQSRYPRRHHDGRTRVQQARGYNQSSSRRQRQSRAQNTARDKGRAPSTKRPASALSRRRKRRRQEYHVSFIEPRATRSRSRQRSRSSASQTLRDYLRKMERDEGRALRNDWYIRATSRRRRCQQQGSWVSYREPRVTRSRTPRRFRSTLPLQQIPRTQPLAIEQGIRLPPRRSERLQERRQVSFTEPQVARN